MRAFVLTTGRAGSVTLARALGHAGNLSVSHQSDRLRETLGYPDNHVAVDPLLVWFAPLLAERFPGARWFHLHRDPDRVAASFNRRWHRPLIQGWQMLSRVPRGRRCCDLYVQAVEAQIRRMNVELTVELGSDHDFTCLWETLGAQGDLSAALATWRTRHNETRRVVGP